MRRYSFDFQPLTQVMEEQALFSLMEDITYDMSSTITIFLQLEADDFDLYELREFANTLTPILQLEEFAYFITNHTNIHFNYHLSVHLLYFAQDSDRIMVLVSRKSNNFERWGRIVPTATSIPSEGE